MTDHSDPLPSIDRTIDLDADPAEVWQRLTDGELTVEWLGVTLDPRPGGSVAVPDRVVIGTVEAVQPNRSITWVWRDPDGDPSQVTIGLEPNGDGTRLTVTERLLPYTITGLAPIVVDDRPLRPMLALAA